LALVFPALPLLGVLILFMWGLVLVVTAHPVHPLPITGIVSDVVERYEGGTYARTEFWLDNDHRVFAANSLGLEPPLSLNHPAHGDQVTVWVNPGIDWSQISRTDILAISVAPESLAAPAHAMWAFRHPNEQAVRERLTGFGILATVGLIVGLSALWEWLGDKHSAKRRLSPADDHTRQRLARTRADSWRK
jgi:hypothetical protein